MRYEPAEDLLTPAEVAKIFRVSPKTVTRWARAGRVSAIRTLGGHRRFRADEIRRVLGELEEPSDEMRHAVVGRTTRRPSNQ
jgi:excisionase family DNA binding protein